MGLLDLLDWVHAGVCDNRRNGLDVNEIPSPSWNCSLTLSARAPTSGGQYHWVSEYAPRSSQRFISYITGMTPFVQKYVALSDTSRLDLCPWMADRSRISCIPGGNNDSRPLGAEQPELRVP